MAATRAKRPEIKISVKDFTALEAYCKVTEGATVTKIVTGLVTDFLARPAVKDAVAKGSMDAKTAKAIEKKKAMIEKMKAELAELQKSNL